MNATERLGAALAGSYAVEREIGRGGMATVYRARDVRHERVVALKVLHPELAGAIGVDRFVREVRLTARLQHPGIVPVLDSGVLPAADGPPLPFYTMPYVEGESLRTRLARERQLPVDEALRVTGDVADALAYAHRQGVVHRDIKPENVLLADGRAYVVDFGVAKALADTGGERLTSTGLAIGTPAYMSPEQASSDAVDARSDQYSLATVLYEMLVGEPPFTGPTTQAVVARRLAERARPLRTVRSTVPPAIERAVLRALERVPADRFPDVAAFAAAVRRDSARGVSPMLGHSRPGWRSLLVAGVLVSLVLGGLVLGGWLLTGTGRRGGRRVADAQVKELYEHGRRGYDRRTQAGMIDAIRNFSAAVQRDSTYTAAWTGLAMTYVRAYERYFTIPGVGRDSMLALAVAAVDGALAADRRSADAWTAQAVVSRNVDPTDLRPALRSLRLAVSLDSTVPPAWHFVAISRAELGDFDGAMEAWRRCVRLGPTYTQGLAFMAQGHYWRRQYDSAAVWADSSIAVDPNYQLGWLMVGFVAEARGDFARASAAFDAARRLSSDVEALHALAGSALAEAQAGRRREARVILGRADSMAAAYTPAPLHVAVWLAQAYAAVGERDRAVAWLTRYEPRRSLHFQLHLRCDPPFDALASDSRFRSLLAAPPSPGRGC